MTKKCLVGLMLYFVLAAYLRAQEHPRMEAYGGFLLMYDEFINDEGNDDERTYLGFIGAFELNVKSWFGIASEFGYGDGLGHEMLKWPESSHYIERSQTSFLIGPRFGYRGERLRFFGHFLVGYNRDSVNFVDDNYSASDGNAAAALGCGLDISVNDKISIRPFQFDLIGTYRNWVRYSGGVVIKFGAIE